ncbi:MAG: OmpA family protein [Magnetococcales bacterium]|nr:OmpA family protein [Magnetococcales bacterium]
MKRIRYSKKLSFVCGMVSLLSLSACATMPAEKEGWMASSGYIQWHPQSGTHTLAAVGTQCYFCEKVQEVVPISVLVVPPREPAPEVKKKCPNPPEGAKVNADGCWILDDLHFKFDRSDIDPKAYWILDEVVTVLNNTKNARIHIEIHGHTDSTGTADYNDGLGKRRANSVLNYLVQHGVETRRLTAISFGLRNPIAPNTTREGRALNRRVELKPNP